MKRPRSNNSESGAAMVLVLTIMAALLAAGAVALSLQINSSRSAGLAASNKRALFCAEAGLAGGRSFVMENSNSWTDMMTGNPVTGYPVRADFDGDGEDDYEVTIRDDEDDDKPNEDSNSRIFMVSRCIKYPAYPAEIAELLDVAVVGGKCTNRLQKGGCASKGGNVNQ